MIPSMNQRDGPDNARPVLISGSVAFALGVVASLLIACTATGGPFWSTGVQLSMYMAAAMTLAGLLGLIFAVPRARADSTESTTERYSANSNLEQISDWLTKILVGAGLVQLGALPAALKSMGRFLGADLPISNGEATAVALVAYGAGAGFLFVYLWVRLRLRILLESSEKEAQEQSSREQQVIDSLSAAAAKSTVHESKQTISTAASEATAAALSRSPSELRWVLWVDDYPSNNTEIVDALRTCGISVDLALSTEEALRLVDPERHGLVITDLGRKERGGNNPDAGVDLIRTLNERNTSLPIIVYSGRRAVARRDELLQAGAILTTDRPTEVFKTAVEIITGVFQG